MQSIRQVLRYTASPLLDRCGGAVTLCCGFVTVGLGGTLGTLAKYMGYRACTRAGVRG
jgi:hypothetical protein